MIVEQHRVEPDSLRPGKTIVFEASAPPSPVREIRMLSGRSVLPSEIQVGAMPDRRLRFRQPLPVKLYAEENMVIAEASVLEEFGTGFSIGEAIIDLGRTLAELYFSLSESQARLGPHLLHQLAVAKQFLEPVAANEGA